MVRMAQVGPDGSTGGYFDVVGPSGGKGRDAGHLPHRRQRRRQGSVEASLRTRRNTAIQVRFLVSDLPTYREGSASSKVKSIYTIFPCDLVCRYGMVGESRISRKEMIVRSMRTMAADPVGVILAVPKELQKVLQWRR